MQKSQKASYAKLVASSPGRITASPLPAQSSQHLHDSQPPTSQSPQKDSSSLCPPTDATPWQSPCCSYHHLLVAEFAVRDRSTDQPPRSTPPQPAPDRPREAPDAHAEPHRPTQQRACPSADSPAPQHPSRAADIQAAQTSSG